MDEKGQFILEVLNRAGYEAYFVGGCVRDFLLGKVPKDFDICTNALPDITESLFEKTIATGKAYGTITVNIEGSNYEVTTFRNESDYDGRRPKAVSFSTTLKEDSARRDFTINAMAMDAKGQIYDYYGGQADLANRLIRFVGDPEARIREDRLRLLRYVRFLCQLDFKSAHEEVECLWSVAISNLSPERVREELNQILLSDCPRLGLTKLKDLGLLEQFFPAIKACYGFVQCHPAHTEDVFEHTLTVVENTPKNLRVRLAALCHDVGKPLTFTLDETGCGHFYGHQLTSEVMAREWLLAMRYSTDVIDDVCLLVREHMRLYTSNSHPAARRLLRAVGADRIEALFALQIADTSACAGDRELFLDQIRAMKETCEAVLAEASAFKVKDLQVNGHELMAIGFKHKAIGLALEELLEQVIDERVLNEKATLLKTALKIWQRTEKERGQL